MLQALSGDFNFASIDGANTTFLYGLMPTGTNATRRKTGVADVELKIGYDALCTECCFVNGYVGVLVPTGNRPQAKYVFEPIVGHNHHVGVLFGSAMFYLIQLG